jgi:NAD(P)H-hydrate epimerase
MAALRAGAGLVTVAVPERVLDTVAGFEPCYTTTPLPCDDAGRWNGGDVERLLEFRKDALALGPGLGQSTELATAVTRLLEAEPAPVVLDADGLNLITGRLDVLARRPGPTILTPHPGEFARLLGREVEPKERERTAAAFAQEHKVTIILKGHRSVIADGRRIVFNPSGNPGMATGGSGDVLTGIVAAFAGQKLAPFDAARLAAWVHGRAGDRAAQRLGEAGMIARDLIDDLPGALAEAVR